MARKKATVDNPLLIQSLRPAMAEVERLIEWEAAKRGGFPNGGRVVPVIATAGKKAGCYGWFMAPNASFSPWSTREGENVAELLINPEYMARDVLDICATVIHECVHLYCYATGVKDCSKSGRHNEDGFKANAELFGLHVELLSKSRGWSKTTLTDELRADLEDNFKPDLVAFNLFKNIKPTNKAAANKTVKFTCEDSECELTACRAVAAWSGFCGICNSPLVVAGK